MKKHLCRTCKNRGIVTEACKNSGKFNGNHHAWCATKGKYTAKNGGHECVEWRSK